MTQQFFFIFFCIVYLINVSRFEVNAACLTSVDCSMNGECERRNSSDPQEQGNCVCGPGWTGSRCEVLNLLPSSPKGGLRLSNNQSSWGGSIIQWNGSWHMFASRMVNNCGLDYWTTNSEVVRAVANSPEGPYEVEDVILPPFAHDTNAIVAPTGEVVLFVTARAGVQPFNCTGPHNMKAQGQEYFDKPGPTPPKDSYMLWAPRPEGPWSKPIMVINSTKWNSDYWNRTGRVAVCDTNLNGIIHDDGSFLGLWRHCETDQLLTIPHLIVASDWRNASSYRPDPSPLFVLGGSGAEDPSNIWTTQNADGMRAYHALFHDEQSTRCMLPTGCSANGRHAFSLDGKTWRYASDDAWTRNVVFSDGTRIQGNTRARPHVVVDKDGNPTHLSTGFKPSADSGYVWTLVTPVK